jgi:hypothetical protein
MIGSFLIKNEKESSDMKEVIFQFAQKASIDAQYNKLHEDYTRIFWM